MDKSALSIIVDHLKVKIFGWDIFISYRRSDSYGYAKALERILNERDILCFIDEYTIDAGDELPMKIKNGLSRSKKMILIVSPEAATPIEPKKEDWIKVEVDTFKKVVIPINIDNSIYNLDIHKLKAKDIRYIQESLIALRTSAPSDNIVNEIEKKFKNDKVNNQANRLLLFTAVLFIFIFFTMYRQWKNNVTDQKAKRLTQVKEMKLALSHFKLNSMWSHYSDSLTKSIQSACAEYPLEVECKSFTDSLNKNKHP